MDKFDNGREFMVMAALITQCPRHQQEQSGAHPFASAGDDVFGDLIDEWNFRMQAGADHCIGRLHVWGDEVVNVGQAHSMVSRRTE